MSVGPWGQASWVSTNQIGAFSQMANSKIEGCRTVCARGLCFDLTPTAKALSMAII